MPARAANVLSVRLLSFCCAAAIRLLLAREWKVADAAKWAGSLRPDLPEGPSAKQMIADGAAEPIESTFVSFPCGWNAIHRASC
jgi:hypothetical protein